MSRMWNLVVLLVLSTMAGWGISVNPAIAYNLSTGTIQDWDTVGIPFYVNQTIYVDALGVYDYGFNGITGPSPLSVAIHPWGGNPSDFTLGSQLYSVTLTSSSPSASGAVWSSPLASAIAVNPGWYMLVATGFDTTNNPTIGGLSVSGGDLTLNTFGGMVSYGVVIFNLGETPYYGTAYGTGGTLSSWSITPSPVSVAGGTFSVPEPSSYALLGSVGLALFLLRRRAKKA